MPRGSRGIRSTLAALFLIVAGCGGSEPEDDSVLAVVAGDPITAKDVEARIRSLPRLARSEFSGSVGRNRMLQQMIEEEVLHLAALEEGLDEDEDVRRRLADYERQIVIQEYLDRAQRKSSEVSEADARAFYEEHVADYEMPRAIRIRLVVNQDPAVVRQAAKVWAQGRAEFADLAKNFSDHVSVVEKSGEVPGWIRDGHSVPWIGNHPAFHDATRDLQAHEVSEVFETPVGHLLVYVEEVQEAGVRTFEEARPDVEKRIARERSTRGLPELLDGLRNRYDVTVMEPPASSAEEILARAQQEADPRERVALLEDFLQRFPDDERAVETQFMVGFIRSEELGDRPGAERAFRRVIEMAPDSELAQSAEWMLTSDGAELPDFEEGESPEEGSS